MRKLKCSFICIMGAVLRPGEFLHDKLYNKWFHGRWHRFSRQNLHSKWKIIPKTPIQFCPFENCYSLLVWCSNLHLFLFVILVSLHVGSKRPFLMMSVYHFRWVLFLPMMFSCPSSSCGLFFYLRRLFHNLIKIQHKCILYNHSMNFHILNRKWLSFVKKKYY